MTGRCIFTTGGRGTQSELYRVTYAGDENTNPVSGKNQEFAKERLIRQKLESLHDNPAPVNKETMSLLDHPDRHIRYAARVAIEQSDAIDWQAIIGPAALDAGGLKTGAIVKTVSPFSLARIRCHPCSSFREFRSIIDCPKYDPASSQHD